MVGTGKTSPRYRAGAVLPAQAVRYVGEEREAPASAAGGEPRAGEVKTVEEDGVIRFIEYTCACGRQVRIQCLYAGEAT